MNAGRDIPETYLMRHSRVLLAGLALSLVTPCVASGQMNRAVVTPRGGFVSFDKASGIEPGAFVGLDLHYDLARYLSLGAALEIARPTTRGQDFVGQITFGDVTHLYEVVQPVTVLSSGLNARVQLPLMERVVPFLLGQVGVYKVYLDPQSAGEHSTFQGLLGAFGGGLDFRIHNEVGIQLDARDHIYFNYDRDDLSPIANQFRVTRFAEDIPKPPRPKDTIHNLVFSLGFSFRPSRGGERN